MQNASRTTGRMRVVGIFAAALGFQCHDSQQTVTAGGRDTDALDYAVASAAHAANPATLPTIAHVAMAPAALVGMAESDPAAFVRYCRDTFLLRGVRDYTCRFDKQESVKSKLGPVEQVAVRFREEPFSVDMQWVRNASSVSRALYVRDAWVDKRGQQLAWFKPTGAIIKIFVPKIKQPIDGPRVKKASRRTLDQFGFGSTLDLIIKYIERAQERNDALRIDYVGESSIHGRPTWVFERHLPFTGEEEPYPDALLRYHIDQEWLVPTGCYSYADHAGRKLLGSYVISDVQFDVGLSGDDFDPEKLGL